MAKIDSAEKPKAKKASREKRPEGSESLAGCFNNFLKAKKAESPIAKKDASGKWTEGKKYKDLKKECSKEWKEFTDTQKLKYAADE